MKRVYTLLGLLTFAFAFSAGAAAQDAIYVTFYQKIQQADILAGKKQEKAAVDLYRAARAGLQKLRQDNPSWNEQIVDFRLRYIAEQLGPLDSKYPVTKAAPKPAPKTRQKAPPPAVQTQLSALNDDLIRERMKSASLNNKLKEALAARPAEVDPAELAKAEKALAAAQEQTAAVNARVAELESAGKDMIDAKEARQLKKAMEDSERQLGKRKKELDAATSDNAKLAEELETLEKKELPALRSENTALKRQVADLSKKAGATDKSEKAAQQLSVQNKLLAKELAEIRGRHRDADRKLSKMVDKSALTRAENALEDKTTDLNRKNAAILKMQREIDALEARVKNTGESARSSSLRKENSALKKNVSELSKKAKEADKVPALEAELKRLAAAVAEQSDALKKVQKENQKLEKLLADPNFKINQ
jgi:predicted  nucleic acid-binding Zn-ribbon protein